MERNKKGHKLHILIGVLYSVICGVLVGAAIFFFKYIAKIIEHKSQDIYENTKGNILYMALVFIFLIACACLMFYIHKKMPEAKGGGIPKSEGVLRGALSFNWLRALVGTVCGSIISYLAGLPVGTEGPSVLIGTSIGDMCTSAPKKNRAYERYINTGGAAAGFAVATGAPFAGILFALEEIHKRFTPMLVVTVSTAVISGFYTNLFLCDAFNINPGLFEIDIFMDFHFNNILHLLLLGILVAVGIGLFDKSIIIVKKVLLKSKVQIHPLFKLIFLFVLVGILGYTFIDGIYSGHHLVEEMLVNNTTVWLLLALLITRLIMMHLVIDSGATGGIFIPTMAIAAVFAALIGKLLIFIGLDESYYAIVVILAICAFIGGTLRAPFTATVLFIEITGGFDNIVYALLVMFVVTVIVEIFDQPSFYDQVIEKMEEEEHNIADKKIDHFEVVVSPNSFVVGKTVRDIMWPNSLTILSIKRTGEDFDKMDKDGERKLYAKDTVVFRCRYYDETKLYNQIKDLVGTEYEIKKITL